MATDPDRGSAGALGPLETALDHAHDAMIQSGESEAARRAFFAALAAAELVLVLEAEVPDGGAKVAPMVLETEDGPLVLAFDTEARMVAFLGQGAATVTLSGRTLSQMLAPEGLGLGLNLEIAPSAIVLPADAMAWLAELSPVQAEVREGQIVQLDPPRDVDPLLLQILDGRLASLVGMAEGACLAQAAYVNGGTALVLALAGVPEAGRPAVSQSLGEALSLAGRAEVALDVVFVEQSAAIWERLARVGLRFEMPQAAARSGPDIRGADPDRPPILR